MSQTLSNQEIVARLRPVRAALRPDLEVSRHIFHGEPFYVVRDPITFRSHNVSARDYHVLIRLKANVSLGETFEELAAENILSRDQEQGFFQFVVTLQQLGFLHLPLADGKVLYERYQRRQQARSREKLVGMLFYRMPLFNPDAFLDRTVRYARPLFTRWAFGLWLLLMLAGGMVLWSRFGDFVNPAEPILASRNLVTLWVILVGLKVLHEFGHAYACRVFGGKVPEMGAYFVLLTPCAYMDASAAWGFPSRKHRIIVSLAGMYVESIVAACAVFVWALTEPSFVHSCAHQIVVVAGIITCVMNANPLMRFDGYYILGDALNIPNLRARSYAQVTALVKRLVLGIQPPQRDHNRVARVQLLIYGLAAMQYKFVLVLAICTMIAVKLGTVGLVVSAVYVVGMVFAGLKRLTAYLWHSPETAAVRPRAVVWSVLVLFAIPSAVLSIPVSRTDYMNGIIAGEQELHLSAPVAGFITDQCVKPGARVESNDVVCQLNNFAVAADVGRAEAEVKLLELQTRIEQSRNPTGYSPSRQRLEHTRTLYEQARADRERLTVRAGHAGVVLNVSHDGQAGYFVNKGQPVATLMWGDWVVRCLASAEDLADMQARVGQPVRIRLAAAAARDSEGTVARISPMGSKEIATPALTHLFGGEIPVSPMNGESDQPYFEVVIHIAESNTLDLRRGMTARVCYKTSSEAYGRRLVRKYRQFVDRLLVK